MGIDYSCTIFYGVIFEPTERQIEEIVTRYDEITGQPYVKTKKSKTYYYANRDWSDFVSELEDIEYDNYEYLEPIYGYEMRGIGVILENLGYNEYCKIPEVSDDIKEEVNDILKKLNINEKPFIQVLFSAY